MKPLSRLFGLTTLSFAAGLIVTAAVAAHHPKPLANQALFDQALAEYKEGRRTAAYGKFVTLADHGDAESARIALMLLRHGQKMHGAGWGASQAQINHWMLLAKQPMAPLVAESGD